MSTTFDYIILKTELSQSDAFGSFYDKLLENEEGSAFSNPLVEDISELLNNVFLKYDSLTEFQKEMLIKIFDEFNQIRTSIDPKRLKSFDHYLNTDDELLLYRETENGLINIIINPEDCIAFSFIPDNSDQRQLYFIHQDGDFERLAYNFFSH
jgi:hypothetical protein